MSLNLDLEKNILQNSKIPNWLKATGKDFNNRPETEFDAAVEAAREGEFQLNAKDTAGGYRPTFRQKTYKRVKRRIAEMEELHEWIEKKGQKEVETGETKIDDFLDGLEESLNSMI